MDRLLSRLAWEKMNEVEYMAYATGVRVIWRRSFVDTKTMFRKAKIESEQDFEILNNAHLPWYHDGSGARCDYSHPQATNYTVEGWVREQKVDPVRDKSKPIVIVTAYDTTFDDRLVVDGCNRCAALAKYGPCRKEPQEILVAEAYGDAVHEIFSCDFQNIRRTRQVKGARKQKAIL